MAIGRKDLELFDTFPLGPTGKVLKLGLADEVERRRIQLLDNPQQTEEISQ